MAQSGYTPIQLYYSTTTTNTPTAGNLVDGELAINIPDGKLFYKDGATVKVIASTASATGTVSSVSVVSTNGFAGSVANATTTPAITLTTTITGILQGNGTAISAASTTGSGAVVLATGAALVTPALGTPTSGDFSSGTFTWPTFNQNTTGSAGSVANSVTFNTTGGASAGTTFNGSVARTIDYSTVGAAPATTGSSILYANGSGGFSNVTIGSNLTFVAGTLSASAPGTGTVTSVSFTGGLISVATATTTPALTVAGTSGGIVYFSSASTWASSAALAANAIVIGGGAGSAPSTTTTGTGVVTAIGNAVNTANGLVTQTATLTASALLLGGGSGTGISSTTTGTGVVTALGIAVDSGSGGLVTNTGTATLTNKRITARSLAAANTSGAITPASDTYDQVNYLLTGSSSFSNPSGTPTNGQKLNIRIYAASTQTISSWSSTSGGYRVIGTTLPSSVAAGKTVYVGCVWNSTDSFWDVVAVATEA